jgi:flagellar basal-body rod modification protein FlgD
MALEIVDVPVTGVNSSAAAKRTTKTTLGKDDFLILLTKQLQNQDPLKPMDDMQFVGQMAQFSSLEQMTNMNKSLETFISRANDSYKLEGMYFLGQKVTAKTAEMTDAIEGTVSAVKFVDGEAIFKVGDHEVKLGDIQLVETPVLES